MSSMKWTFGDIYKKVSDYLGTGTSPSGTALTKAKDITFRGYMKFLFPLNPKDSEIYTWSFLRQEFKIVTEANKFVYPLPDNFERFDQNGKITYGPDENNTFLTYVPLHKIHEHRNFSVASSEPFLYSIRTAAFDKVVGSKKELVLYPTPSAAYELIGYYIITPAKPESDGDFFIGGPLESDAILQCCLAVAENDEDEQMGVQTERAVEMLHTLIRKDSGDSPDSVGFVVDGNLDVGSLFDYRKWWIPRGPHTVYGYEL